MLNTTTPATEFLAPLDVGGVLIDPPLVLAPMAGHSHHALRQLCREGDACGLVTTALISSRAMQYASSQQATFARFDWTPDEHPLAVQLVGGDAHEMAEAARVVEDAGADIVDINLGCWVPKIARKGNAGAALLNDVDRAAAVVGAVVQAVNIPVTVKVRSGWQSGAPTAVRFAQIAEAVGVAAIAVHARFADQGFQGAADWSIIREVKQTVRDIPVIGNGDICNAVDVRHMMTVTGCDGVMIGRAALGRPWLFRQIAHELRTGQAFAVPTLHERAAIMLRHAELTLQSSPHPAEKTIRELRGQLVCYVRDLPQAASVRESIVHIDTVDDIKRALAPWLSNAD